MGEGRERRGTEVQRGRRVATCFPAPALLPHKHDHPSLTSKVPPQEEGGSFKQPLVPALLIMAAGLTLLCAAPLCVPTSTTSRAASPRSRRCSPSWCRRTCWPSAGVAKCVAKCGQSVGQGMAIEQRHGGRISYLGKWDVPCSGYIFTGLPVHNTFHTCLGSDLGATTRVIKSGLLATCCAATGAARALMCGWWRSWLSRRCATQTDCR